MFFGGYSIIINHVGLTV